MSIINIFINQEEVQTILDDAKHQAKVQQEQIINDANVKANGLVQSAQAEIQQEKQRAIADINNRVSELSVLIASKFRDFFIDYFRSN